MDCDTQENLDMRQLVDQFGWDWYGRYCAILGKIGMLVNERRQTFALDTNDGSPFNVRLLADDLGTTVARLSVVLDYLAEHSLIDKTAWKEKNLIYAPKLRERADEYTRKLLTKSPSTPAQEEEVDKSKKKNRKNTTQTALPEKVRYADDVSLTVMEYNNLMSIYGEPVAKEAINVLSYYKGQSGKTYKSDYKAILNWAIDRAQENLAKKKPITKWVPPEQRQQA